MMFWFKPKTTVLDIFTDDPFVYEHAKIDWAVKYYPEWWKKLPILHPSDGLPTLKSCRGFTRLHKKSLVIPMWRNLKLDIEDNTVRQFKWNFFTALLPYTTTGPLLSSHHSEQYQGFVNEDYQHIKLSAPWWVRCNKFVEFMYSDPVWSRPNINDFTVLPGVVDYKYQPTTNVNIMFKYEDKAREIVLHVGDPIAMLTPLTGERIKLKHHLIDTKEIERELPTLRIGSTLKNKYKDRMKFINDKDKSEASKCPFGFK